MSLPTTPAVVEQDVTEVIARTITFAHDLNGSTISSAVWGVPSGLGLLDQSATTTTATCLLSATATGIYRVMCTVTLANGEVLTTHVTVVVLR